MFKLALDKLLHLLAGVAVGAFLAPAGPGVGAIGAFLAGWAKERLWDRQRNRRAVRAGMPPAHTVDPRDAWFTAAGGLLADAWLNWLAPIAMKALASGFTML